MARVRFPFPAAAITVRLKADTTYDGAPYDRYFLDNFYRRVDAVAAGFAANDRLFEKNGSTCISIRSATLFV
jgi:hypothetical protein